MVDMTVLEAVAARCRSSSLLLGTIRIYKTHSKEWVFIFENLDTIHLCNQYFKTPSRHSHHSCGLRNSMILLGNNTSYEQENPSVNSSRQADSHLSSSGDLQDVVRLHSLALSRIHWMLSFFTCHECSRRRKMSSKLSLRHKIISSEDSRRYSFSTRYIVGPSHNKMYSSHG